jgi:hypothetical protein
LKLYYKINNGVWITPSNQIDGLTGGTVTIRREDSEGKITYAFSSELTFYGSDWNAIYAWLVTDVNGYNNFVEVKLVDECCNKEYLFALEASAIDWCEEICSGTGTLVEYTPESKNYKALKNTMIWDNWNGFTSTKKHPRISYCVELRPAFLQVIILFFGIILTIIMDILVPVVAIISVIIQGICAIISIVGGNCPSGLANGILDDYTFYIGEVNEMMVGCGRKHPSPLIRDYIQNGCDKNQIAFVSSIFNNAASEHYNAVYLFAPVRKGIDEDDTTSYWIEENKPNLNVLMLLDQLKTLYNFEYRIIGNTLYVEPEAYFMNLPSWIDITQIPISRKKVCYSWNGDKKPAYATLYYQQDSIEWVGNEAIDRQGDIVDWNTPPSPTQAGELALTAMFGASRFRNDGIDTDWLDWFNFWPNYVSLIIKYRKALLMNHGTTAMPKVLIWDGNDLDNAFVQNNYQPSGSTLQTAPFPLFINQHFNYPMWLSEPLNNSIPNLYEFWKTKNPRYYGYTGREFKITISYLCAEILALDIDHPITTAFGKAWCNEIEINDKEKTITLTGEI